MLGFTAILCIALGAGAAAALNMWYEADLDAKMKRTAKRPLPAGRMDRQSALHFGVGLAFFSVMLMGLAVNCVAAVDPRRLDPLLRGRLHDLAEAADAAEHRHRRRRRRVSAADRLGGGDRPRRACCRSCCSRSSSCGRRRISGRSSLFVRTDYAAAGVPMLPVVGGRRATRQPDPALQPADGGGGGRALAARPRRARSTGSSPRRFSLVFVGIARPGAALSRGDRAGAR